MVCTLQYSIMEYQSDAKGWHTVIWDIFGSWENYAKWNESDRKEQELYGFAHVWGIKQKVTKNTWNQQTKISQVQTMEWWLPEEEGVDKEDQIFGDGQKLGFG